jgi:hypothetical protein
MLWLRIGHVGPTCQAERPSLSLHRLWALDTFSTASDGHIDKTVFGNAPTHARPTKVMRLAGHTLAQLSPCFVPHHSRMPYCL